MVRHDKQELDHQAHNPDRVPYNVHFEMMDVEEVEWLYPKNHFDYIHSRFMIGSISSWKRYVRKAFE